MANSKSKPKGFNLSGKGKKYGFNVVPNESVSWSLQSADGKYFGDVSYEAYKAVESGTLDSYKPKDNEKNIIAEFRKHPGITLKSQDGKEIGKVSYDAYAAILNNKVTDYKPHSQEEKKVISDYTVSVQKQAKNERINSNPTFARYNIDPAEFDASDLDKWAKNHNYEPKFNSATGMEYRPKYTGGFLGIGAKKLSTDQEDKDFQVLLQLANNNELTKLAQKDNGALMSATIGFADGLSFGTITSLADKNAKRRYEKAGLDEDNYVSPSQAWDKTIESHPWANLGGDIAGSLASTVGVGSLVRSATATLFPKLANIGAKTTTAIVKGSQAGATATTATSKVLSNMAKWVSKSPVAQNIINDGITFSITSSARTAGHGGSASDIFQAGITGLASGAISGGVEAKLGQIGLQFLFNKKLQHKVLPEIARVSLSNAFGGTAYNLTYYALSPADKKPTVEDMVRDFAVDLAFGAIFSAKGTIDASKSSKANIDNLYTKMEHDFKTLSEMNLSKSPDVNGMKNLAQNVIEYADTMQKLLKGEPVKTTVDGKTTEVVMTDYRFIGQNEYVKSMIDDLETIKGRAIDFLNENADGFISDSQSNSANTTSATDVSQTNTDSDISRKTATTEEISPTEKVVVEENATTTAIEQRNTFTDELDDIASTEMPKVGVGDTFVENGTDKLIKVISRDDATSTVELTTADGKKTMKSIANEVIDRLAVDDKYTQVNTPAETANTPTATRVNAENTPVTDKSRTVSYTNDNKKIDLKFKVVSADDLIVSNELDGRINPNYPQELQPRDRDRVSSQNQIRQIANNLNPARLSESTNVSEGAPIVGPDNVVESGNGRTLAIKLAYQIGASDAYRNYIISNADNLGIDVSNLPENPILVRERLTEVDRVEFTRKANESSIGSLSATEQAKVDAENLTNDVLNLLIANDDGIINTNDNKDFISAVVTRVFKSEDLNNVVNASGGLSARGLERITNAIFYKAYGDASLSARLSESLDNDMKNATKVLLNIAPKVVSIKNDIAAGVLYDFDFSEDIVNAIKLFEACRNDNKTIEDYALQTSLFEKEPQLVMRMAYVFETKNRGAKQATDFYNILLDTVEGMGNPNQMSFDIIETYQTKEEIFDATVKRFNEGVEPKNTVAIPESIYRPESEEGRENDRRGINESSWNEPNENAKVVDAVGVQRDNGSAEKTGINAEDEQLRQKNESVVGKSEEVSNPKNKTIRTKKSDWSAHDIEWSIPGKKSPIAYSTKATSDMIDYLADENPTLTISELKDIINYDDDAKKVLQQYIDAGYGNQIANEWFSDDKERIRNIAIAKIQEENGKKETITKTESVEKTTEETPQPDVTLTDKCTLTATKRTDGDKKDIWVISLNEKISKDKFNELRKTIKPYGGNWSNFTKTLDLKPIPGFMFYSEPSAEAINAFNDFFKAEELDNSKSNENLSNELPNETTVDNNEVLKNQPESDTIEEKTSSETPTVAEKETTVSKGEDLSEIEPENDTRKNRGTKAVAKFVAAKLANGKKISALELSKVSNVAFGGTMADNAYSIKDAYDAMELGVNQHILSMKEVSADKMLEILELLPTQTKRTEEMVKFQQFSTPPSIAYLANYTANVNANDIMLEPSAGIGGIAVFAKKDGAKVYVNELDSRRLEVLKNMPFDGFYNENAEQLNNILGGEIEPTVIVMNPPFSSSAERNMKKTKIGASHIEQALKILAPNGRLVAIVGNSMADGEPAFRNWWNDIKSEYNVRANIGINGKNYNKYGTNFDIQMLVIDKNGPTTDTVTGYVDTLQELQDKLGGIRDERPAIDYSANEQRTPATTRQEVDATGERGNNGNGTLSDTSSRADKGKSTDKSGTSGKSTAKDIQSTDAEHGKSDSVKSENTDVMVDENRRVGSGQSDGLVGEENSNRVDNSDSGQSDVQTRRDEPRKRVKKKELTDSIFEQYQPQSLRVKNAQAHPAKVSESAAMSAIEPPSINYKPNISQDIIDKGVVSDVQLEAISYAGQSHSQTLPNGTTRGFFLGDGTGIGKGRTIAGMILDNYNQGRKKSVWVTLNSSLVNDAKRDVKALFGDSDLVTQFVGGNKADSVLNTDEAIMVISYSTLSKGFDNKNSNFEKLVKWLGKDFDGLIVFDEAHKMGNATSVKGTRGVKKASQTGIAGVALQEALPKAKIVYSSATGATEVENLSYASRLGLWGEGTPFVNGDEFVSKVKAGGLAAMELIARDMKAMGVYLSRNISYDDVQYDKITHNITPQQKKIYDELASSWQIVLQNINKALEATNQDKDGHARGRALGAFWSAQQRFFNQILTSMQVPSVITDIETQLADGKSCVIQLVSTNESAQNQEFERLKSEDLDLDEFDLTPKQVLMSLIENSFPVQQFDEYRDDNGNVRSKPVFDSKGNPVINREALKQREELLTKLGSIKVPSSPIDMIINHFGTDMVAENTGRARRVMQKDGKTIEEKIGNKKDADVDAFQNGNKRIIIFSKAGGTGKSYHADKSAKNQQQRVHYLLEAGWQADNAVQGFGRSHRSNQAVAPIFKLVTTNLKGQMRFISTIAKRLDQLGAMTKGQRQAGSQGMFSASDNLENSFAADVLAGFYKDLVLNRVDGIDDGFAIIEKLGLKNKILDEYNQILPTASELREVNKFLNRILSLESSEQNTVFEGYSQRLQDATEKAMQSGTLDKGLENYKADKITLNEVQDIREDDRSGAKTKYYNLTAEHKIKPVKFEDIPTESKSFVGYYRNKNTGNVRAVMQTSSSTDQYGNVTQNYKLIGQVRPEYIPQHRLYGNWVEIKADEAKKAWNEELSKLPEFRKENLHLISGVVLPVWDKLPTENVRIYRVLTSDGEMLIGRVVSEDMIDETLRRLGSSRKREKIATKDLITSIKNGDKVYLENDWTLVSRKVSGEDRIELLGPSYEHHDMLMDKGVFAERIQYRTRYFVPADTNTEKIIDDILKLSPVMRVETEKYSIESEELSNEQSGNDLLSGNGNRGSNASAGKQAKRISDFKQKIKGKTRAERQIFAKELLAKGQTEEITDGNRQFNIVKPEAYNDDMLSIVKEGKEMGKDVGFFIGHGKLKFSDLKIDAIERGNKILLRYDGTFAPQSLFKHENTHIEWDNPEMQKAKDIILNDLSESDKKKILSQERYQNYMTLYKDKENKIDIVWQEFVADVFGGMNEYTSQYIDLVVDYWHDGKVINRYNPAEYINSIDAGGNETVLDNIGFGDEYSLSDYSEKALPIGSMKNDFHKDLTPSEWANYYEVVNKFDWDNEMRSQEFDFVVKLNGKTIFSTYERGKPQVYYITNTETNLEEGALYDRAEAERIFGLIRQNEIQRNETSGDGVVTVGEKSDSDASKLTDSSQKDRDGFGIYDGGEKVLHTGISEDITDDDVHYSLSIDDDIAELTPERKKEIFEQWEKDHAGVDKPTQKQLWAERAEWIAHNMTRVFPDIPERGEKGTFFAEFRKMMIQWKALPQTSMFMTQDKLNKMTKDLTPDEFKTFSELVYFLDLQEEAQIQKERGYEEILLPNEISPNEVNQIVKELNEEATENVKKALSKRQKIWDNLKEQYVTLNQYVGFDTSDKFKRKNYYHHQVIAYMNQGGKGVAKGKDIEIKAGRGWLKERHGSTDAINTDFLAVEYKAMLQMQYDIYVANMLGKIKDQYDIKPQLEKKAFDNNKKLLQEIITKEATDENGNLMLDNKGKPDSETYRQQQWYNQRIMFGFSNLFDLAKVGMLPTFNGQYGNVIRALERNNLNAPGLYNYVGELASMELPETATDEELQAQISARTVLKYTSQKKAWVKSVLADKYQTWETLANSMKDTHSIHQPRRGNYFYTKTTVDEDAFNKAFTDMIMGLVAGENGVDTTADIKKLFEQYSDTIRLVGAAFEQWVIPKEIETTMNKVANPNQASAVSQASRTILSAWKGWATSVNPLRTVKFGIRNMIGDLDAVIAGNPKIVVYSKQAVDEIYQAMKHKKYSPEFMEWVERGGYSSLIFANEMDTEMQDKLFSHLKGKEGFNIFKIPAKIFEGYYNGVESAHNFREAILRYSAYLHFKNEIIKNGGNVKDNVASNRYIIQGLKSVQDKAYQLSKDLLGAYDEVNAMGQAVRRHAIPFYSFTETNLKRYYRLFENIIMSDDNIPKKAGKLMLKALMVNAVTLLMVAWNKLVMKDEDDELPPSVRNIPHITLGKIGDEVFAFRQLGSFSELLEWIGFEDYKWTEEDKTAALDKAVGMISPVFKTPVEMLTGLNFYPSITQPRAIRDKVEHLFSTLGVDEVYRAVVGKPTKGVGDIAKGAITYSYDYKESAYYEILDIKREYQGDTDNTIYGQTPKSNALYYMKTAIRYKDKKAALKYLDEYFEYGGTAKGITQSIAMLNPMYGYTSKDTIEAGQAFVNSLSDDEKDKLKIAMSYYENDLMLPENVSALLRKKDITDEEAKNLLTNYINSKCK